MKEIDLAIIGDVAFDNLFNLDKQETTNKLAGSAYIAAVGASTVSKRVGIVARAGEDFPRSKLEKRGIDIRGLAVVNDRKTARYSVFCRNGEVCEFKEERNVASEAHPEIFPESYLTAKYIHLATCPPNHHLIWLENLSTRINSQTTISVDIFETFIKKYPELTMATLKKAGMIFMNEHELGLLRQFGEVSFSVPMILKKGPVGAVYINGPEIIAARAPKVPVRDTTGAGEVLAGTFLALRTQGTPVEEALQKAVNTASFSVTKIGVEHL